MTQITVPPQDERLQPLLADLPDDLFSERFYRTWELVDRYGAACVIELLSGLSIAAGLSQPQSVAEVCASIGCTPEFAPVVDWLLRRAHELGLVRQEASGPAQRYGLDAPLPPSRRAAIREACLAVDSAAAPALDLLDAAAQAYPPVARGEVSGQDALFGLGQTRLWLEYFNNQNPIYAVNNRLGAFVASSRLPAGAFSILEVGGGAGSASEAFLERLTEAGRLDAVERYRFTEPSPFFRRRAERQLRASWPQIPWEVAALDLDRSFSSQDTTGGGFDLIYGANVLHVARDLDATLAEIRDALKPGGWLVAAESVRPFAGRTISLELVFLILESYRNVALDDDRRPTPGFLTCEQWAGLLSDNGFSEIAVVPEQKRIREIYPRFYTGVVCGRKPRS